MGLGGGNVSMGKTSALSRLLSPGCTLSICEERKPLGSQPASAPGSGRVWAGDACGAQFVIATPGSHYAVVFNQRATSSQKCHHAVKLLEKLPFFSVFWVSVCISVIFGCLKIRRVKSNGNADIKITYMYRNY